VAMRWRSKDGCAADQASIRRGGAIELRPRFGTSSGLRTADPVCEVPGRRSFRRAGLQPFRCRLVSRYHRIGKTPAIAIAMGSGRKLGLAAFPPPQRRAGRRAIAIPVIEYGHLGPPAAVHPAAACCDEVGCGKGRPAAATGARVLIKQAIDTICRRAASTARGCACKRRVRRRQRRHTTRRQIRAPRCGGGSPVRWRQDNPLDRHPRAMEGSPVTKVYLLIELRIAYSCDSRIRNRRPSRGDDATRILSGRPRSPARYARYGIDRAVEGLKRSVSCDDVHQASPTLPSPHGGRANISVETGSSSRRVVHTASCNFAALRRSISRRPKLAHLDLCSITSHAAAWRPAIVLAPAVSAVLEGLGPRYVGVYPAAPSSSSARRRRSTASAARRHHEDSARARRGSGADLKAVHVRHIRSRITHRTLRR